jgi:hypothetical protein
MLPGHNCVSIHIRTRTTKSEMLENSPGYPGRAMRIWIEGMKMNGAAA